MSSANSSSKRVRGDAEHASSSASEDGDADVGPPIPTDVAHGDDDDADVGPPIPAPSDGAKKKKKRRGACSVG